MYIEQRKRLVDWVRRQLTGRQADGACALPEEIRGVPPTERFPCGALYPVSGDGEGVDPAMEDENETVRSDGDDLSEQGAEPCVVRRFVPPSSLGFSFYVEGDDIEFRILCAACRYECLKRDEQGRFTNTWTRTSSQEAVKVFTGPPGKRIPRQPMPVLDNLAAVDVAWRPFGAGWIVTVTLCNTQEMGEWNNDYTVDWAKKTLFAVRLRCEIERGEIGIYPRVERSLLDDEEQEIELQYANRRIYAIGHGCAVDWEEREGKIHALRSDPMPVVEVPQVTADTGNTETSGVLSLARLSEEWQEVLARELAGFIDGYGDWILTQRDFMAQFSAEDRTTGARIVARMELAISRMRTGLALLKNDVNAQKAFALANRAMLDQMRQHDLVSGAERPVEAYRWRPFQLAFLLTVLESAINEESDFRDTVDLIWFPTGGGKTEAYLGLIAFLIVRRRLAFPTAGGGTAVLMRYTLRLLTRDQFQRATRLICALELIRRECDYLGTEAISAGIWVGGASSPNTFKAANDEIVEARQTGGKPPLVIDRCPWCGKTFAIGDYQSSLTEFRFRCRNPDCAFGVARDGILPCNVVDEALYEQPPTLLIATLDKFARLAWEKRTNAFFGGGNSRPPELIIQDELHLIAGALGSVAGLYEAALDTVLQSRGVYPKYIASTATIRMAAEQVKRLYGREVAVFPPPGLCCEDSFFARSVPLAKRPGRMYVGYFAPMQNRQKCLAPLAAALLLAPLELFAEQEEAALLLDAWWTQVVYHGSLKGVGNSHTIFDHDVREFMRLLSGTLVTKERQEENPAKRPRPAIAQLTSQQTAEENAAIFAQLKKSREHSDDCLDAVLATNMVSVGLDVARLALMVINGQPLTTAEYIQASSRVGRGDVPGIVFANYYRNQARSLSHYEGFRSYHDAFYRFVEPTSVTPYTYQARLRALHAALVIAVRHACAGMLSNESAGCFDPQAAEVARVIELLETRCKKSAPEDQREEIALHLRRLAEEWKDKAARCRENRRALNYQVPDNDMGRDRLLYAHDAKIPGLWATLNSMRHVENTVLLKVL
jgi:hypothetical protein